MWNHGYAILDENLYAKIDEDFAANSEALTQDIVCLEKVVLTTKKRKQTCKSDYF